jgi:hypothetical protein
MPPSGELGVGAQPGGMGSEFENLPPMVKSLLTELASRVHVANVLIEDAKVASEQATRFFHNEMLSEAWSKDKVPAKGGAPNLVGKKHRTEDDVDLRPPKPDEGDKD